MLSWLKKIIFYVNDLEKENLKAGIINVIHPYAGAYTYIDQETYRKYINDKQKAVSRRNRHTKK